MKNLVWIMLIVFVSHTLNNALMGQETTKEAKKLQKSEQKEKKKQAEQAEWEKAKSLAESKRFVFQATDMYTDNGTIPLDPKINFFYVIDEDAVLQFTFTGLQSVPNPNGLGGITSEAKVTAFEVRANNVKKPVTINLTAKPLAGQGTGIHQLSLTIFSDDYADLLFVNTGTRLKGSIMPPDKSNIYQGTTR